MTLQSPWRILIVAEAPSDQRRLSFLMDHLIQRHRGNIDLDQIRQFEQFDGMPYLKIAAIPKLVRDLGLDRRYSPGGPNKGDGGTLRKLYQVLQKKRLITPELVIIWGRDDDGAPSRRDEAMQARQNLRSLPRLVLAIASECGEAWVIAGWRAAAHNDTRILEDIRKQLGFNPCAYPERLSHKENVPKSAKSILRKLFSDDQDREDNALVVAVDAETSSGCGLRAFCDDVAAWLAEASV